MKLALLQRIFAKLTTDTILSDNVIEYFDDRFLPDLPDNGLITKAMMVSYVPGAVAPISTTITAGTTPVSLTVPYTDMVDPTILFRTTDGHPYSPVDYQDTGSSVVLTSPDDGTGKSADTYTMIIKA